MDRETGLDAPVLASPGAGPDVPVSGSDAIRPAQKTECRAAGEKGRGIFATAPIRAGEVIEIAPVLLLPHGDAGAGEATVLARHIYVWDPDSPHGFAIALGFGSLYNHSYAANALFTRDYDAARIAYTAVRDIAAGEEICINYNGALDDDSAQDFAVLP